jgi:hypothetical protein
MLLSELKNTSRTSRDTITPHKAVPSVCSARAEVLGMLCGNESHSSFTHNRPEATVAVWAGYVYSGPVTFAWVSFKIRVLVQNVVHRLRSANFLRYEIVYRG